MKVKIKQLTDRHIARLLAKIAKVHDLPEIIQDAIKQEFFYLSKDIKQQVINKSNPENDDRFNK